MFRTAINMAVRAAEGVDLLSEAIPLVEKALEKDEALKADAQTLHVLMANHYMVTRQVDKLLAIAEDGKATWPDNKQWAFTEGVALKMAGKKKEAIAILRDIDVEGNTAEFVLQISVSFQSLIVTTTAAAQQLHACFKTLCIREVVY